MEPNYSKRITKLSAMMFQNSIAKYYNQVIKISESELPKFLL